MATLVGQRIVVEKTYAQMAALILAAELNPFLWYKITDRGDNGLVFRAAAVNRLESTGLRYMLCPATYASGLDAYDNDWIGVWNAVKQATATTGQLCIWNGLVWVAGAVLGTVAPDVTMDDEENPVVSGWTVIPKATFDNHEYVEIIFDVNYSFSDNWINYQMDIYGNKFGANKADTLRYSGNTDINYCDITDWNINTISSENLYLSGNTAYYSNNNNSIVINNLIVEGFISGNNCTSIIGNMCSCDIRDNFCDRIASNVSKSISFNITSSNIESNHCIDISSNTCMGIFKNICHDIIGNTISGQISNNKCNTIAYNSHLPETFCSIISNVNNGDITGVWDADVTDAVVDKTGTAEATTTAA